MSKENLINIVDAIEIGDAIGLEDAFVAEMKERVAARIDEYRSDVAKSFFTEAAETELTFDELLEEIDQLDEISKETLGNYIKKASVRAAAHGGFHGHDHADKEVRNRGDSWRHYNKMNKRLKGIRKATDKLTKEDLDFLVDYLKTDDQIVEDILALDEISKETLGNYIKKASGVLASTRHSARQAANAAVASNSMHAYDYNRKEADKHYKTYANRINGITKATDKLTKEQVETIDAVLTELENEAV